MAIYVGECSICQGAVTVPEFWGGITPPRPTCSSCGAVAKRKGPIVDMEPRRPHKLPMQRLP